MLPFTNNHPISGGKSRWKQQPITDPTGLFICFAVRRLKYPFLSFAPQFWQLSFASQFWQLIITTVLITATRNSLPCATIFLLNKIYKKIQIFDLYTCINTREDSGANKYLSTSSNEFYHSIWLSCLFSTDMHYLKIKINGQ